MTRLLLLAVVCLGVLATDARADEGWGLSKWSPFAKKSTPTRTASAKKGVLNRFSLPSFQRKPNQPTAFQRINQGAKGLLTRTKDILTPWDNGASKKSTQRGWGWFRSEPEPEEVLTPNDFLKLPRPR